MKKIELTILTPTYNRANMLIHCYKSLRNQTKHQFQWLIIDDGSNDETPDIINTFNKENNNFIIDYHYKDNGGKHTALNFAHPYIKGEIVLFLDSDDELEKNAVEQILFYWNKYRDNSLICGLMFLKATRNKVLATKPFPCNEYHTNYFAGRTNINHQGDCCEIIRTSVLKEFLFPIFKNEKFLSEGILWARTSEKYEIVFINKILYFFDYLDTGLTKAGRELRIRNPLGGMRVNEEYINRNVKYRYRIKRIILFSCYGYFAGFKLKTMLSEIKINKITFLIVQPLSILLYKYWKTKYLSRCSA